MLADPRVYGHFPDSHSPAALGKALAGQELRVDVNTYCVRVRNCSHFKLEVFEGNVSLDADADSVEEAIKDAELVSTALAGAGIRHRLTVVDQNDNEIAHFGIAE